MLKHHRLNSNTKKVEKFILAMFCVERDGGVGLSWEKLSKIE